MNKKYLILSVVVVLIAGSFLAGQFMVGPSISGTANSAGVIHGGISCAQITRVDGIVENLGCDHNYFMSEGSEFIADEVATSGSGNAIDWMFLGNGTNWNADLSAHTDEIFDCGLNATSITWADVGGTGNISATYTWTMTGCSSIVVNTTGLNCSACALGTEFFAANNFTSSATLSSGDQLNVTWFVWAA